LCFYASKTGEDTTNPCETAANAEVHVPRKSFARREDYALKKDYTWEPIE
jgi:hypothetical protein